jgi:hypothetical protein
VRPEGLCKLIKISYLIQSRRLLWQYLKECEVEEKCKLGKHVATGENHGLLNTITLENNSRHTSLTTSGMSGNENTVFVLFCSVS